MKKAKINPVNQIFRQSAFVYVLLMFSLFEVYFPNRYFRVQEDHMACYIFLTAAFVFLSLFSLLIYMPTSKSPEDLTPGQRFHKFLQSFSVTDYAVIAFWAACVVSTVFSQNPGGSFTGENGRFMGLGMFSLFVLTYFLVSRGLKFKNSLFLVLFTTADVLFLLALFQRLDSSFLGLYNNMKPDSIPAYISTVGNIDFFSTFIMLVLPLASCLFCLGENNALRWHYLLTAFLASVALIVTDVDSGYIAVIFMFVMLGFFVFRNLETLMRYFLLLAVFLAACKTVFALFTAGRVSLAFLKSTPRFLVDSGKVYFILAAVLILFLLAFLGVKKGFSLTKTLKVFKLLYILAVSASAVLLAFALLWFSLVNKTGNLGSFGQYLRFNYQWGDNRGYILSLAAGAFLKFNPFQKLFGYGMDMFQLAIVQFEHFKPSALSRNQVYDSAHNEVANLLIGVGLLGCVSYLVFVFSQIARCLRNAKKSPLLLALALCISCYFVQSLANIAIPMVFPLYIILIAIAEAIQREPSPNSALAAAAFSGAGGSAAGNSRAGKRKGSPALSRSPSHAGPADAQEAAWGRRLKKSQKQRMAKQQNEKSRGR